ncbi:hypothetical protein MPRS_51860 [Mycobacterium paraseoulense]|nr:hypothetical protein MPRS_51860 [Mycobacterium paraseoulense]
MSGGLVASRRRDCQLIGSQLTVGNPSKDYQKPVQFSGPRSREATQVPKRTIIITGSSDGFGAAAKRPIVIVTDAAQGVW